MKHFFYAFLFYMTLFNARAQVFTVGQCSGTPSGGLGSTVYAPMYSTSTANATSRAAIIYPASQLSSLAGQVITNVYFYRLSATGSMAGSPNFKVYLKEVDRADWGASFSSWNDTITGATLVYNGNPATIVGSTAGWKGFPVASGFTYSGTRNLAVLTEYTNTTASTTINWTYEYIGPCISTTNGNTTKYNNNTSGVLADTLNSSNYRRPYIAFDILLSCYPPSNVTASNATTTGAQINWTAPATAPAGGYEYYYSNSATAPTAATVATGSVAAGTTSLSLSGLASSTAYYVWVRSVCSGNDKSPWSLSATFTTLVAPPVNDLPSGAITLTVDAACASPAPYTNVAATLSTNEPRIACKGSQTGGSLVWFKFTAPPSGFVRVTTDIAVGGTLTDTRLGLFTALSDTALGSFQIIACDDDNGSSTSLSNASTVYASGLTPGATYYVGVDQWNGAGTGTFCVQVHTVTTAMLATSGSCTQGQTLTGYLSGYRGWLSMVNNTGQLIANVRSNTATTSTVMYTPSLNVNTAGVRADGSGTYYLDRNMRIVNSLAGNYDVQFFLLNTELAVLQAVAPATTLSNLNVTRIKGESACSANFVSGGAVNDSLLLQTGSGSANGISWITANTPGFSNFYLHTGNAPLPITLEYLKGKQAGTGNLLNWKVSCTAPQITLVLQRSSDGRNFNRTISSIQATRARCSQPFDATDASPLTGVNYYRLQMIDIDGKITYSPIVAILNGKAGAELVGLYPTLVQDQATLSITASRTTQLQLHITDISGKRIRTISQLINSGSTLVPINTAGLAAGIYQLTGVLDGNRTQTLRFVKQ